MGESRHLVHWYIENVFSHLSARFYQSLKNFGAGYFEVHDDGCEGGLGELAGVVDGVAVQDDDLHGPGQLEYPLDLRLHLRQVGRPAVRH